jgi:FlaA1/EpsC-like NDP-sugar epimerase
VNQGFSSRTAGQPARAIGRPDRNIDITKALHALRRERVLVTGAAGAIGYPLVRVLREAGVHTIATDVDTSRPWDCHHMDITNFLEVLETCAMHEPTVILHLAAAKDAPSGEKDPWSVARINVQGTQNVINSGKRVIFTSTCKAIAPETAYGASKLLGERMVMNAGGSVARLVNVPECGPNVVQIWRSIRKDAPIPVTDCTRFMITRREAIALILWSAVLEPGRYRVNPGSTVHMSDFARRLYPTRSQVKVPRRRGDRMNEPDVGPHEVLLPTDVPFVDQIASIHD